MTGFADRLRNTRPHEAAGRPHGVRPAGLGACSRSVPAADPGQSTVEYAVLTAGFLALLAGLSALWHASADGTFSVHALMAASHHVQLTLPGGIADIFLY